VIAVETLASLVALVIVAALTAVTHDPWLIPPLAASMALVVGGAHFPLSQPRNVIGGHVMSAIVGVLAWVLAGGSLPSASKVSEDHLLDLEREAFLSLCGEPKTLERIQYTLKTGKTLRN